jgi:hypothetical protein
MERSAGERVVTRSNSWSFGHVNAPSTFATATRRSVSWRQPPRNTSARKPKRTPTAAVVVGTGLNVWMQSVLLASHTYRGTARWLDATMATGISHGRTLTVPSREVVMTCAPSCSRNESATRKERANCVYTRAAHRDEDGRVDGGEVAAELLEGTPGLEAVNPARTHNGRLSGARAHAHASKAKRQEVRQGGPPPRGLVGGRAEELRAVPRELQRCAHGRLRESAPGRPAVSQVTAPVCACGNLRTHEPVRRRHTCSAEVG